MEEFLKIVWETQEAVGAVGSEEDFFAPLKERLQDLLSPRLYKEVEDILCDCQYKHENFYAMEGMKLAIGVLNKTYKVTV
jgi:hypothetical protein